MCIRDSFFSACVCSACSGQSFCLGQPAAPPSLEPQLSERQMSEPQWSERQLPERQLPGRQ
eukprot:2439263-Alexandrium_andersonii.AAC.1